MIKSITVNDWILLVIFLFSIAALTISILAYKRAGKIAQSVHKEKNRTQKQEMTKPILERYKSSDVALMLTAKRNAQNQLRLILKNTGVVPAREIEFIIGEAIRVINKEELITGIKEVKLVVVNSAIKPRLTVIDSNTLFPITEVLPGVVVDIIALTTMGYGKICDFPISINWIDDRGMRHFQDEVVTI